MSTDKTPEPMGIKNATREKYWKELDTPGRIDRLRRVIKDQDFLIKRMGDYLNQLIDHEHSDGKMVQRINHPNAESYGGFHPRKHHDEWF